MPFESRAGFEGIALGIHFLGLDATAQGLEHAEAVVSWLSSRFDPPTAAALAQGNARRLLARAVGIIPV